MVTRVKQPEFAEAKPVIVTPQMALSWLEKMAPQRNIRQQKVDSISRDIANEKWRVNGETIKFDRNGNICDGQHRLLAIIKANKPVKTFLVYGIEEEAIGTMNDSDRGTTGDYLSMVHKVKNANQVAALLKVIFYYEVYSRFPVNHSRGNSGWIKPTKNELMTVLLAHDPSKGEELTKYAITSGAHLPKVIPTSYWSFVKYATTMADARSSAVFLNAIVTGNTQIKTLSTLHSKIMAFLNTKNQNPRTGYWAEIVVKAWNGFMTGKTFNLLRADNKEDNSTFIGFTPEHCRAIDRRQDANK